MSASSGFSVVSLVEAALDSSSPAASRSRLRTLVAELNGSGSEAAVAALASFAATALLYLRLRTGRDEREWLQLIAADLECPEALAS